MATSAMSSIFEQVPMQWGLRGDPYFWEKARIHFQQFPTKLTKEEFISEFGKFSIDVAGENILESNKELIRVQACVGSGGMSNGCVSPTFWKNQAIPLLTDRLEKLKN